MWYVESSEAHILTDEELGGEENMAMWTIYQVDNYRLLQKMFLVIITVLVKMQVTLKSRKRQEIYGYLSSPEICSLIMK